MKQRELFFISSGYPELSAHKEIHHDILGFFRGKPPFSPLQRKNLTFPVMIGQKIPCKKVEGRDVLNSRKFLEGKKMKNTISTVTLGKRSESNHRIHIPNSWGQSRPGRILLHSLCLLQHPERAAWHFKGIWRELSLA